MSHTNIQAGLGVAAIGAMPSVGLYFGVYSYSKEKLLPFLNSVMKPTDESSEARVKTINIAASAAIGNTIASFSRVPYEVVKQKLQTGEYSSTMGALKDMVQTGGLRAFFPMGGVSIQMIR
jgi:solute carrier family 25 S-adenosylmethionine transporter 26